MDNENNLTGKASYVNPLFSWIDLFRTYKSDITEKEVDYILWNETCYPFDNETTIEQVKNYFDNELTQK